MYCAKCGTEVKEGASFCSACGSPVASPPIAPAVAAPSYAPPVQPTWTPKSSAGFAGFWLRFVALMIDGFILTIPFSFVFVAIVSALGLTSVIEQWQPDQSPEALFLALGLGFCILAALALFGITWLYHAIFESSGWQATPGKKALGLYVTDLDGRRISFAHALGRNLAKIISGHFTIGIGYLMAGFTAKKQALHDMIASCLVLRKLE